MGRVGLDLDRLQAEHDELRGGPGLLWQTGEATTLHRVSEVPYHPTRSGRSSGKDWDLGTRDTSTISAIIADAPLVVKRYFRTKPCGRKRSGRRRSRFPEHADHGFSAMSIKLYGRQTVFPARTSRAKPARRGGAQRRRRGQGGIRRALPADVHPARPSSFPAPALGGRRCVAASGERKRARLPLPARGASATSVPPRKRSARGNRCQGPQLRRWPAGRETFGRAAPVDARRAGGHRWGRQPTGGGVVGLAEPGHPTRTSPAHRTAMGTWR